MIDRGTVLQYQNNGDYVGLANYLSRFHYEDDNKQKGLNTIIKDLRNKSRMMTGLYDKANDEQKSAIAFLNSLGSGRMVGVDDIKDSNGNITSSNKFAEQYINSMRSIGGYDATKVSIEFGGKTNKRKFLGIDWLAKDDEYDTDAFTKFSRDSMLSEKTLRDNGVKFRNINGKRVMDIDKNNPLYFRVVENLAKLKGNNGELRFRVAGIDGNGNYIKLNEPEKSILHPYSEIEERNGAYINTVGQYGPMPAYELQFSSIEHNINKAKELRNQVFNPDETPDKITYNAGMVMSNIGAKDAQLDLYHSRGLISDGFYDKEKKGIYDKLNGMIIGQSLTSYNMYVSNNLGDTGADRTLVKQNAKEKVHIEDMLKAAAESGRAYYNAYSDGVQFGILVTIPATTKEKTKLTNSESDITGETIQVFLPNFVKDAAEQSFMRDTKTRAAIELNKAKRYNYEVKVAGGKLTPNGDEFIYTSDDGKMENKSFDDAQREMNKTIIAEDGMDQANSLFRHEDGNFRTECLDDNGNLKPNFIKDIRNKVEAYSLTAMSELYPQAFNVYEQAVKVAKQQNINYDINSNEGMNNILSIIQSLGGADINVSDIYKIWLEKNRLATYILDNIGYRNNNFEIQ